MKKFLSLVFLITFVLIGVGRAADWESTSEELEILRTSSDYASLSAEQKARRRADATAWLDALRNEGFADCNGRLTTFRIKPDGEDEGQAVSQGEGDPDLTLAITSHDLTGSYSSEPIYLAVVAVNDNVIVLHRAIEPNVLSIIHAGLGDLLGHSVDFSDTRFYETLKKVSTPQGMNIVLNGWIYNRANGQGVQSRAPEERIFQASSVQRCRALSQNYLDEVTQKPFPDVQINFDDFGRILPDKNLDSESLASTFKMLMQQIETSARAEQADLERFTKAGEPKQLFADRSVYVSAGDPGFPVLTMTGGNIVVQFLNPQTMQSVSTVSLVSHDLLGADRLTLHDQSPVSAERLADYELIHVSQENGINTYASIRHFLNETYSTLEKFRRETPRQKPITALRDFPLMVAALKRMHFLSDHNQEIAGRATIFWKPDWKDVGAEGVLAYTSGNSGHTKNEKTLAGQAWNSFYGDRALFTNFTDAALDEFSDVSFHELIHILDFNHDLPNSAQSKTLRADDEAKWEAEYEKTGRGEMLAAMENSPLYAEGFTKLSSNPRWKLIIQDETQKLKTKMPDRSDREIEALIRQGSAEEYEKAIFGEKLEKVDASWKKIYVYLHSEMEHLAWKAQVSFLKHEKGMTLPQILNHLGQAAGYTNGQFEQHPWADQFYKRLYDED